MKRQKLYAKKSKGVIFLRNKCLLETSNNVYLKRKGENKKEKSAWVNCQQLG